MNKIELPHAHYYPKQAPSQPQLQLRQDGSTRSYSHYSNIMPAGSSLPVVAAAGGTSNGTTTTDTGLYFKIVCDPGHERTARELRGLPKEMRERVWADMTGDPSTTHYFVNPEDPTFVQERITALRSAVLAIIKETLHNHHNHNNNHNSHDPPTFYATVVAARRNGSNTSGTASSDRSTFGSGGFGTTGTVSANPSPFALGQAYRQSPTLFTASSAPPSSSSSSSSSTSSSSSNNFYLLFLRAEEFQVEAACQRIIRFFANKLELFGLDTLTSVIRLDDLSEADKESLASGGIQILPRRDRAGRLVIVSRYQSFVYQDKMNLVRFDFLDCFCVLGMLGLGGVGDAIRCDRMRGSCCRGLDIFPIYILENLTRVFSY
jgi:hypothetical protein